MYHKFFGGFFIFLTLLVCGACQAQNKKNSKKKVKTLRTAYIEPDIYANVPHKLLNVRSNDTFYIEEDIDLGGDVFEIPLGVTLVSRGGVVKNGVLYGNNTSIEKSNPLFENITIRGTWDVKNISTSLFKSLSSDNALRNVIALANSNVDNTIIIEKGDYWFSLVHEAECGLVIPSNTKVILNGNLLLRPNDLKRYYIVYVPSRNVFISGKGFIVGDKSLHVNNGGEWGMGIRFQTAQNCNVSNLTIKDCWGDCVCVSKESRDIEISKCNLFNGRRQGISVTSAIGVDIKDCIIKDVGGTNPEYAIDIEPDSYGSVKNVVIQNVKSVNCVGGFSVHVRKNSKSIVENIRISNCIVTKSRKASFWICGGKNISVNGCTIADVKSTYVFNVKHASNVIIENNDIQTPNYVFRDIRMVKCKGNKVKNGKLQPFLLRK